MTIKRARKKIAKAFEQDPGFRKAYQDNIAMVIYDAYRGYRINIQRSNHLADLIVKRIFEDN